jgi:hypothetical protein
LPATAGSSRRMKRRRCAASPPIARCSTTSSKSSGRIFSTAGDAVLAEFSSAVEAVRCAIDVQESLRTRNLAYPPSRQMNFRIGITIGDVVEREGDLLGDGVNIAARLEGIAPVGGIAVAVPNSMKVTGFFQPATDRAITTGEREDVARRLKDNSGGWSAVALGIRGYAGLALKAGSETESIDAALADCGARDRECRVIAIGMLSVEAK